MIHGTRNGALEVVSLSVRRIKEKLSVTILLTQHMMHADAEMARFITLIQDEHLSGKFEARDGCIATI